MIHFVYIPLILFLVIIQLLEEQQMFIYKTTTNYKDIPINTFLKFNKSYQYFESLDKEKQYKVTNDESFYNPHLIVIDREILPTNKQKTREWNPFNKDIKDWKKKL